MGIFNRNNQGIIFTPHPSVSERKKRRRRYNTVIVPMIRKNENGLLLAFERIGEVLVTVLSLFCGVGFNFSFLLILGFFFLIIYELAWLKYFRSDRTMKDMLASFLIIPVPIACLPVLAFLILGIVSGNILLIISSIILAIGHIGIHLDHRRNL